jgi:N-acetylmuramoyl-L-alanine amidase
MTLRPNQKMSNQKMILACMIFIMCLMSFTVKASEILDLRTGNHIDKSRLVIEMTGHMDFQATLNQKSQSLIIHLPNKQWNVKGNDVLEAPFQSVQQRSLYDDLITLNIPLSSPYVIQTAFMIAGDPHRLVIDMIPASILEYEQQTNIKHGPLNLPVSKTRLDHLISGLSYNETPTPIAKPEKIKKPIVVIDAGHGGRDPGAVSKIGIKEKDITLPVSKRLARILNQTGRYDARLTRADDRFIRLHNRVKIAQRANADLFISIHADSVGNNVTRGASVYTLSDTASDAQTAKLAARENQADLIGGMDLNVEDEDVSAILIDLSMRESMNQSKILANKVIAGFRASGVETLRGPHRYAGFAVLKAPDIPSILIETGFVSNEAQARELLQPNHQNRIGRAILKSLDRYFGF